MNCPKCGQKVQTMDTRTTCENHVRRTRACYKCGYVFTTYEIPATEYGMYTKEKSETLEVNAK